MFSNDRNKLRQFYFEAWRKYQEQTPIEPLEAQVIEIILQHPEYHEILNNIEKYQEYEFGDFNPFLHMSLHLALQEQIITNRPAGIQAIFEQLRRQFSNSLEVEHLMMECLERVLWEAQRNGVMPDEDTYLERLRKLGLPPS